MPDTTRDPANANASPTRPATGDDAGAAEPVARPERGAEPDDLPAPSEETRPADAPVLRGAARAPAPAGGALQRVGRAVGSLVARRRLRGRVFLLLDRSASMAHDDKLGQVRRGALRFFAEAWQRDYAVGAIAFSRGADVLSGATRRPARFARRLERLRLDDGTAMARALALGIWRLRFRRGERVMILITDGMPDDPGRTLAAAARARALGITVIAVGTDHADEAFLAALAPRPELAVRVASRDVERRVGELAGALPGGAPRDD